MAKDSGKIRLKHILISILLILFLDTFLFSELRSQYRDYFASIKLLPLEILLMLGTNFTLLTTTSLKLLNKKTRFTQILIFCLSLWSADFFIEFIYDTPIMSLAIAKLFYKSSDFALLNILLNGLKLALVAYLFYRFFSFILKPTRFLPHKVASVMTVLYLLHTPPCYLIEDAYLYGFLQCHSELYPTFNNLFTLGYDRVVDDFLGYKPVPYSKNSDYIDVHLKRAPLTAVASFIAWFFYVWVTRWIFRKTCLLFFKVRNKFRKTSEGGRWESPILAF